MIELALQARRGYFHLSVECRLSAEWTVVFGPSGSGKSTLLRLIAGLDHGREDAEVRGQVVFDGHALTDTASGAWIRPGQRNLAFVTQHAGLFPHLNVEANVAFGLYKLDKTIRRQRVDEMLELVDAKELRTRHIQNLSGGQMQRISLARALATDPKLLLLDEPFSALDAVASDAMLLRLDEWRKAHRVQVVMATHNVADAVALGAEVLLLNEGRQAGLGPAAEVLAAERERILGRLGQA